MNSYGYRFLHEFHSRFLFTSVCILLFLSMGLPATHAQESGPVVQWHGIQWMHYVNGSQINVISEGTAKYWIGTNGGMVSVDKDDGEESFFTMGEAQSQLPSNDVRAVYEQGGRVFQGGEGILWIGTSKGLVKYNGHDEGILFNRSNSRLKANIITDFAAGSDGTIWAGTYNADDVLESGFVRIEGGKITPYEVAKGAYSTENNNVMSLDVADNGIVWLGTEKNGVVKFDGSARTFFTSDNSNLPAHNRIVDLTVRSDGTVWVVTDLGDVAHYDGSSWTTGSYAGANLPDNALSVDFDSNDQLWIGTESGLHHYDGSDWIVYDAGTSDLPGNRVRSLLIDSADTKWTGTQRNGLASFDGAAWTQYETSRSIIPEGANISDLMVDRNNNLWIASGGFGGQNLGAIRFSGGTFELFTTSNSTLHDNRVRLYVEDNNGNIWAGTDYGISVYDGQSWETRNGYLQEVTNSALADMTVDSDNHIWIAPKNSGVFEYDGSQWIHHTTSNPGLPNSNVTALQADGQGNVYMAYSDFDTGGLVKYDGSQLTDYNADDYGFSNMEINSMTIDEEGRVYLGSNFNGLFVFEGGSFTNYNMENTKLPANRIAELTLDQSGNLWMALSNRLSAFARFDGKHFTIFTSDNTKLPDTFVSAIAADSSGYKWVANENGDLMRINYGSDPITNFSASVRSGTASLTVQFYEEVTNKVTDYNWTFNGGTPSSSSQPNPEVTYNSAGTYDVKLEARNVSGSHTVVKEDYITVRSSDTQPTAYWQNYTSGSIVNAIAEQGRIIWAATNGGITKIYRDQQLTEFFNAGNSGLPSNLVNDVAVGPNGNRWYATSEGVVRHEGSSWETHNTSNSNLASDNVTAVEVKSDGTVWVGFTSTSLFSSLDTFVMTYNGNRWSAFDLSSLSLNVSGINDIYTDSDGNVWIGTNGGLVKYDGTSKTGFSTSNSNIPGNRVQVSRTDGQGTLWVGTLGGLASYDGSSWTPHKMEGTYFDRSISTHDLGFEEDGDLWIGSSALGALHYDRSQFTAYTKDESKLNDNDVLSVLIDQNGNKWFGAELNLLVSDDSQGFRSVDHQPAGLAFFNDTTWTTIQTSGSPLPANNVEDIHFDHRGNAWFIASAQSDLFGGLSSGAGLVRYDRESWQIFDEANSPISGAANNAVAVDADDNVWLGHESGIMKYDGTRWISYTSDDFGTSNATVVELEVAGGTEIWAGLSSGGVLHFNGSSWTHHSPSSTPLTSRPVQDIEYTPGAGNIWIGTNNGGLVQYDGSSWTSFTTGNSGIPANTVSAIESTGDGDLWLGLVESSFTGSTPYFVEMAVSGSSFSEIGLQDGMGEITDIYTDAAGNAWLAFQVGSSADGTIARYDGNQVNYMHKGNSKLTGSGILSIQKDASGNYWAGTDGSGLIVFEETGLPTALRPDEQFDDGMPDKVSLGNNYPNPFNPTTRIQYALPKVTEVQISVYNVLGRRVATLVEGRRSAGVHTVVFDASNLASGMYIYRLKANQKVKTGKMLLVK